MGGDERKAAGLGRDDEPQNSGAIVVVNHGDDQWQEVWIRSGANIGNWYYLGGEYGRPYRSEIPHHPKWEDVLARGPVTLLVPGQQDAYRAGWRNGRKDLWDRTEPLIYDEPATVPQQPARDGCPCGCPVDGEYACGCGDPCPCDPGCAFCCEPPRDRSGT